ncbi:MAG: aminodeoxychorismate/anthranilate synthase component II [Deltaproteobacteria bacterium]|nr:aminodeoxychorismate/anthranilate synthase component II [Deltaproteobacteria bacterium]
MILLIDNYDSFTYNLYQYLGEMGEELVVYRNDKITIDEIRGLKPDKIVISPGPGTPLEAGISREVVFRFGEEIPILGICLGYLAIGAVFGAEVVKASTLFHGKTSEITHLNQGIYEGFPQNLLVGRYHSLILRKETLPDCLEITAWTKDNVIMGLRHKDYPIEGIQFHPESILTKDGKQILRRFLDLY